ncbi:MAG: hypothetical protein A2512_04450 [Deltaproteobacteria bacterium RIFOXYD12_FULL_56_24]|nr:MAG: hypothetical protein A2512_04450 [Deltaproteobacteria bacterium RIFOXYD12_FULL_56_24]
MCFLQGNYFKAKTPKRKGNGFVYRKKKTQRLCAPALIFFIFDESIQYRNQDSECQTQSPPAGRTARNPGDFTLATCG